MLVWTVVAAVAAVVAAVPVLTQGPTLWHRTLGQRAHQQRQVERLAIDMRFDRFERLWGGVFDFSHPVPESRTAAYFVSPWCIVQVIYGDVNGAVDAFSVTSRHQRFRPSFHHDVGTAQLLVTTFASWGESFTAVRWATRYFTYLEEFYGGNPADYLSYQLAITPFGSHDGTSALDTTSPTFRGETAITTYGRSRESWGTDVYIGGDPQHLRRVVPRAARGAVGSVWG